MDNDTEKDLKEMLTERLGVIETAGAAVRKAQKTYLLSFAALGIGTLITLLSFLFPIKSLVPSFIVSVAPLCFLVLCNEARHQLINKKLEFLSLVTKNAIRTTKELIEIIQKNAVEAEELFESMKGGDESDG